MIETTEEASDTVEEIATIEEDTTVKEEVIESNLDTTEEVVEETVSLFNRLKSGLTKAKQGITDKIDAVLNSYTTIDEDLLEELEEILITADVGVNTTMEMIDNLRDAIKSKGLTNPLVACTFVATIANITTKVNIINNFFTLDFLIFFLLFLLIFILVFIFISLFIHF